MVGTYATHSPGTVVAIFGIWAAGGAYCPIDPAFPAERQHTMLAAAGCHKVLTTQEGLALPPGIEEIQLAEIQADPEAGRVMWAAPNSPAYCLFTSGSTGEPKPVITSRRAIGTTVPRCATCSDLPGDRVLQFASLNWDTCFEEILPTLTAGATPGDPRRGAHRLVSRVSCGMVDQRADHRAGPADRVLARARSLPDRRAGPAPADASGW